MQAAKNLFEHVVEMPAYYIGIPEAGQLLCCQFAVADGIVFCFKSSYYFLYTW